MNLEFLHEEKSANQMWIQSSTFLSKPRNKERKKKKPTQQKAILLQLYSETQVFYFSLC